MIFRIAPEETKHMLFQQISSFYPISDQEKYIIEETWDEVMDKTERCFSMNRNKYYSREINGVRDTYFDALHTCQWLIFLYKLSNTIFRISSGGGGTHWMLIRVA